MALSYRPPVTLPRTDRRLPARVAYRPMRAAGGRSSIALLRGGLQVEGGRSWWGWYTPRRPLPGSVISTRRPHDTSLIVEQGTSFSVIQDTNLSTSRHIR